MPGAPPRQSKKLPTNDDEEVKLNLAWGHLFSRPDIFTLSEIVQKAEGKQNKWKENKELWEDEYEVDSSDYFFNSDMHGNVWEWCVCTEPADDGYLSGRILRGGSWCDPPRFCRSAMRRWLDEDRGGPDIGFRVALVPAEPDSPQKGKTQR